MRNQPARLAFVETFSTSSRAALRAAAGHAAACGPPCPYGLTPSGPAAAARPAMGRGHGQQDAEIVATAWCPVSA
ncbi:MAG: hypothetical protein LC777_14210, partial [Actinobacteria bacterium]|nr:hypothetical protein [Actinomycetota bacterium]